MVNVNTHNALKKIILILAHVVDKMGFNLEDGESNNTKGNIKILLNLECQDY